MSSPSRTPIFPFRPGLRNEAFMAPLPALARALPRHLICCHLLIVVVFVQREQSHCDAATVPSVFCSTGEVAAVAGGATAHQPLPLTYKNKAAFLSNCPPRRCIVHVKCPSTSPLTRSNQCDRTKAACTHFVAETTGKRIFPRRPLSRPVNWSSRQSRQPRLGRATSKRDKSRARTCNCCLMLLTCA